MKALDKLLSNMRETIDASFNAPPAKPGQPEAQPATAGPLEGWRNDRGVGLLQLDRIVEDPDQPRDAFDADDLAGLATSVKAHGVLQPVLVRFRAELGKWMLIGGARRYRAALAAGLVAIPARRTEGEPSRAELLEQRIAEQLVRSDWTPCEEARAISDIMSERGWNGHAASNTLGLGEKRISRALALLELPEDLQARVDAGEISPTAGVELAKLPPEEARTLAGQGLTVKEIAAAVKRRRRRMPRLGTAPPVPDVSPRSVTRFAVGGGHVVVALQSASSASAIVAALQEALAQAQGLTREAA